MSYNYNHRERAIMNETKIPNPNNKPNNIKIKSASKVE